VVSISGGACDILADRAADLGAPIPELAPETTAAIGEFFAAYGTIQNPLDVTGAAVIDPSIFTKAIAAMSQDPSIGVVAVVNSIPWEPDGQPWFGAAIAKGIGDGIALAKDAPAVWVNQVLQPTTAYTKELMQEAGVPYVLPGLRSAIFALQRIGVWSQRIQDFTSSPSERPTPPVPAGWERRGAWSEDRARQLLVDAGIPVVPARLVTSPEEAAAAAAELDGPVALKIVSPDILHKSDIGGVRLDVQSEEAVRDAYAAVVAATATVPAARVDGVLVSPMRAPATELLVGVVRDPQWGPMLAVALGGILVEVLDDSALSPLPVTPGTARRMLESLRGAAVLHGVRGSAPADLDALADVVSHIGDLAVALGDELVSLEVNPLRVDGSSIEALDVVVEWKDK
jgi:acyl-CoA synthetase (NDP forming)